MTRPPPRRHALCLPVCTALLLALAGCAKAPGDSYFPLDAGHRWRYQVSTEMEGQGVERENFEISTLGPDRLDSAPSWRRRSSSGMDYWLRSDESGIYRVASKTELQDEPQPDKPPRYVLKTPLAVGNNWQASTPAYLLRRRSEFPPEVRHSHPPVPMNYAIEALGQTVQTAAGNFSDCIKVKGQAAIRVFADPASGWRDLPLTTLEWYCKGVGLVRLERHEPAQSPFLVGGSLTMELTEWD